MIKNSEQCQLKCIEEITEYSKLDKIFEDIRWRLRRIKRRVLQLISKFSSGADPVTKKPANIETPEIKPGDMVRVLAQDEMSILIGNSVRYKGAPLMEQMYEYCGKQYRVVDEVYYFYDEVKDKLCKCKDLVILDGVLCKGKKRMYLQDCELNCYLFWPKDFLKKI
jgi:hypothetical protein